jgi:shikimate kinase
MDDSLHAGSLPKVPIVLIGMMGAGKTSVGLALSTVLGRPFLDLDEEIETQTGRSISEIFAEDGEPCFRLVEREVLMQSLERSPDIILATGGGAVCTDPVWAALHGNARVVWLDVPVEELADRAQLKGGRPLLEGVSSPRRVLRDLLVVRRKWYERADLRISTGGMSLEESVKAVHDRLKEESS